MFESDIAPHPFGSLITVQALLQQFSTLQHWEERYRQLIILGRKLPELDDVYKLAEIEIEGCENRLWLGHKYRKDGTLHFYGSSEGRIVRGLLAVLLTAIEGKSARQLRENDPLILFRELGLWDQLSISRNAGLVALAAAVKRAAERHYPPD